MKNSRMKVKRHYTLHYTDAIVNFDAAVAHSSIKSDYILFEEKSGGYSHLGIAKDKHHGDRYVETFFYEHTKKYIVGQKIIKVKAFKLFDANNKLFVEDTFKE